MGFRRFHDGNCCVCKRHAEHYCDHCGRFVCKDHIILKSAPNTFKKFEFCPDCAKAKKKAIDIDTNRRNPSHVD